MTLGCYDVTEHSNLNVHVSIICFIARTLAVTTLFIHRNLNVTVQFHWQWLHYLILSFSIQSVNVTDENIQYTIVNLNVFLLRIVMTGN